MGLTRYQKAEIRQKLDGMAHRQALREQARGWNRRVAAMRKARRDGSLNQWQDALLFMAANGVKWTEQITFGMRVVTTQHGMILPYRPNGILDWTSCASRRLSERGLRMVQEQMFSGETSSSSSA